MSESKFDFSKAYNAFEDSTVQLVKDHIDLVQAKKSSLNSNELLQFINDNRTDLESNLQDKLSEFSDLCIANSDKEKIKEQRTLNPIFLKSFVMSLHTARLGQLVAFYDFDAGKILRS